MPCPFPGMDPYLERPTIWPDFHNRLITYLCAALRPLLRPRYLPLTQDRLYVVESQRPIYPDVSLLQTSAPTRGGATAVLEEVEVDAPAVFELEVEEIRQPVLHIIEPAAGNRLVTAIEVLSPDNKAAGEGRTSYLQKRDELWRGGANLVEIDLLRAGASTVRVAASELARLRPWHYLVTVTRRVPPRQEIYAVPLQSRLPRVGIPLTAGEADVKLDLQPAFARCWEEGPYPELLGYEGPPPGELKKEEVDWCSAILALAGLRRGPSTPDMQE